MRVVGGVARSNQRFAYCGSVSIQVAEYIYPLQIVGRICRSHLLYQMGNKLPSPQNRLKRNAIRAATPSLIYHRLIPNRLQPPLDGGGEGGRLRAVHYAVVKG